MIRIEIHKCTLATFLNGKHGSLIKGRTSGIKKKKKKAQWLAQCLAPLSHPSSWENGPTMTGCLKCAALNKNRGLQNYFINLQRDWRKKYDATLCASTQRWVKTNSGISNSEISKLSKYQDFQLCNLTPTLLLAFPDLLWSKSGKLMWANKSFSHCSITLPPSLCRHRLPRTLSSHPPQSTQNGHCNPALLLIRSQVSQVELPGVPKGELYFRNLSMSNEEKKPWAWGHPDQWSKETENEGGKKAHPRFC